MHTRISEPPFSVGVTVLVGVAKHQHASGRAALVEHTDDHVAVLSNDEVARWSGAVGKDDRAKALGELDLRIAAARCGGRGGFARAGGERRHGDQSNWKTRHY